MKLNRFLDVVIAVGALLAFVMLAGTAFVPLVVGGQ